LVAGVGGLGKLNPDIVKGYATLSRAGQKVGHLDEKTRELIALAVAITLRCDGCITVHTAAARRRLFHPRARRIRRRRRNQIYRLS
jgi:AhpD family alkylhydroperoxidase